MNKTAAVFFDLDGTLLDTAPDLLFALNELRKIKGLDAVPLATLRKIANYGAKAILKVGFNVDHEDQQHAALFHELREKFLSIYEKNLATATVFFPSVDTFLARLEQNHIPWGIITNKPTKYTHALLQALGISDRPACVVCCDTTTHAKPSPIPLLYACEKIAVNPGQCLFVGDALTDIQAGKAAGMTTLLALYGYIDPDEDTSTWGRMGIWLILTSFTGGLKVMCL